MVILSTPVNISPSWMERAWRDAAQHCIERVVNDEIQGMRPEWIVIDDVPDGVIERMQAWLNEPMTREVIAPKRNADLQREYGTHRGSKGKRKRW